MLSNEKCCGHQQTPTHGDTKLLLCLQLHHHRHPHRLPGGRDCLYNGASRCDQQSRLPYKRRGSINLHIYFSAWHLTLYQPQQETRSSDKTPQEDKKKKSCLGTIPLALAHSRWHAERAPSGGILGALEAHSPLQFRVCRMFLMSRQSESQKRPKCHSYTTAS